MAANQAQASERDAARELQAYTPLVQALCESVKSLPDPEFAERASWLFPLISAMVTAGGVDVRQSVREILETRVVVLVAAGAPAVLSSVGKGRGTSGKVTLETLQREQQRAL
jgi:hypothetical protein